LVDVTEVAHVRPAVLRVRAGVLAPVAVLDEVASHADLSVDDLPLGAIMRPTHCRPAKMLWIGRAGHRELAGVHRPVKAGDRDPGRLLPALGDLWGQWRSRNGDRAYRGQLDWPVEQPGHGGRHADHHGSSCRGGGLEA